MGWGGSGGAPARHRPPALGSGAPCPAPHQGLLRRVVPVGPGFRRPPSLGCKPPQTRLTQLFCGDRARHRGLAVPSRGLARRWLGLLGWAGGRPAAVHGVAQASQACGSVPRSLPGHSLGGAGLRICRLRPRLSRGDSREGGGNADGGERRRGTDRMESQGDRETGGTERARRRQCLLPVATWLQSRVASHSRPPPPNWIQGDNADLTPQWEVGRMSVCHGSGRREEGWQVGDGWMGGGRRDRGTLLGKSKPRLMPRPIAPGAW